MSRVIETPATGGSWHTLTPDGALAHLGSGSAGLTTTEVLVRRQRYGPNALPAVKPVPVWVILAAQLRSVIVWLLVAAGGIAFATGETADGVAIAVVLAINIGLGFVTELRGRRAMEGLRTLVAIRARVLRDGTLHELDATELVPGDVIAIGAGANVPADARLIETTSLAVMEATLTGESVPVEKQADVVLANGISLPDRVNMVYQGTSVSSGRARAVVVATGRDTELGRIGALVAGIRDQRTPLERRLDSLGQRLAGVAIVIAALIALVEAIKGVALARVVQTGIAVAVAAVPEGLPAVVTIAMAIGVHRMARRRALVRRLPTVETLGSTTVICTDKTRTLTSGEMALASVWVDGREHLLREAEGGESPAAKDAPACQTVMHALQVGALSSRLIERVVNDRVVVVEETPEDRALFEAAAQSGIDRSGLLLTRPEVAELPFSNARRLMASFHRASGGLVAFVKGAPDQVIDRCSRVLTASGELPLGADDRLELRAHNRGMAERGLRVLALAEGPVQASDMESLRGLTFVAFVGMIDPPAPGVKETVAQLMQAGIRIIMLTGDQVATARAVARDLGILDSSGTSASGAALDQLSDEGLAAQVRKLAVCGRVSPEVKLRIVRTLQQQGEVVAMLGDGVNDAAALRKADIGVAMGRRGTDAAREAAGIVLSDDRFETVAVAVEEGRAIFDNIQRFVFYLFSCNLGELTTLLAAGITGLPLPLLPLQLLWLNLVTDTFPALALAFEPAESDVMRNPPRDPRSQIMSRAFALSTVRFGALIGAVSFSAFLWGLWQFPGQPAMATTLSFMTLAFAQLFHLGNARSRSPVLTPARVLANRYALGAVLTGIGLQVATVLVPALTRVLGLAPMAPREWAIVLALSVIPAIAGQAAKQWRTRSTSPAGARRDPSRRRAA